MALSTLSSSVTSQWLYDVFLSFRGEDTRHTFTAHLYRALTQKGIHTFIDADELRRGDEISPALLQAIENSRIFIIVLSKNYATSTWCLEELLKILDECNKSEQKRVLPVFYHVDPSDVRHQRKSFGKALAKHAEKLNIDMKLQLWKDALQEVANLSGYHLMRNGNESKFIEEIVQDISRTANDHLYLNVAEHPVGLKPRVEDANLLLSVGTNDIRMLGIFGVGGIGKTTLAKAIYNSIAFQFEACCFLEIFSDTLDKAYGLVQLQEKLLVKILGDCRSLKVDNIAAGINMIKRRFHSKRVLLILDGVDHLTQLKTLAGARDWFGKGSRIIITTRDQHLLTTHGVDSKYEMTGLNQDDAFKLFCWHAFKREEPVDGYGDFVEQIVHYAGSLPLVLVVLGSDLNDRSESEWISAIDEYKQIPHEDIQKVLQTSYDRLSENEKNVFLDIACFYNGELRVQNVFIQMLDIFGFKPNFSIPRLREKCLISELNGSLKMHDLLRDLGREIVRQESPNNPGARSRLFFHEDVREVLEEDTGTDRVEAIVTNFPKGDGIIHLSPNAFKSMKRLRIFRCLNAHFSGEPNSLPNSLRVLDWPNCPIQSMPSKFRGEKLSILRMHDSRILEIRLGFKNLTVMDFWGCEFLTKLSDISRCPNLEMINLNHCTNLVEVHDSVGFLDKLVHLHTIGCSNLKSFPRKLQLRSLLYLNLDGCSSLQNFPEIECEMKHLWHVSLNGTAIEELPSSIGYLTGLGSLDLKECVNLKRLPSSIHQLRSLGYINLDGCPNIISFGMDEEVHNGQPSTPYVMSTTNSKSEHLALYLINSVLSKSNFFEPVHFFPNLAKLDLSGSDIVSLPASIRRFVSVWLLELNNCKQLQEIKEFPPNLTELRANGCISLESLPEISRVFYFPRKYRDDTDINMIEMARCYKVMNMGICMPNPTWNLAKLIFPGNKIPDWFSHCQEISNYHRCEFEIKVSPPYNLDDIIGIAICVVIRRFWTSDMEIDSSTLHKTFYHHKKGQLFRGMMFPQINLNEMDSDHVLLWYLTREDIKDLTGISLDQADNLRVIFGSRPKSGIFQRCGVHLLYKQNEHNVEDIHENVDIRLDIAPIEAIGNLANSMEHESQLSKRRRVDYDDDGINLIELYPQQRKPDSTFYIKLLLDTTDGQPVATEPNCCYLCGKKISKVTKICLEEDCYMRRPFT